MIAHQRVQDLVKARTAKLLRFINHQSTIDRFAVGKTGPLVVRNLFRALQADIFTAFVFSEEEGTTFLDNLKASPNTTEDLGMDMLDLCHDEKRDRYFFWESESPFKYILPAIDRNAPTDHLKAESWLAGLAQRFEENERLAKGDARTQASMRGSDQGVYSKLLHWRDDNGRPLSFEQRASEVLDHTGQSIKSLVLHRQYQLGFSGWTRCRACRSTVHPKAAEYPPRYPIASSARAPHLSTS